MIDPLLLAKIARTLADEGIGGNQFERIFTRIVSLMPDAPAVSLDEWCEKNLPIYKDPMGGFRTIAMIKDARSTYGVTLLDAKNAVDKAKRNASDADLQALRDKLSV
jgi:hypothetical protein